MRRQEGGEAQPCDKMDEDIDNLRNVRRSIAEVILIMDAREC
jgi:hypothetical protein